MSHHADEIKAFLLGLWLDPDLNQSLAFQKLLFCPLFSVRLYLLKSSLAFPHQALVPIPSTWQPGSSLD